MSSDNGSVNSSNDDQIMKKAFEKETYLVKKFWDFKESASFLDLSDTVQSQ